MCKKKYTPCMAMIIRHRQERSVPYFSFFRGIYDENTNQFDTDFIEFGSGTAPEDSDDRRSSSGNKNSLKSREQNYGNQYKNQNSPQSVTFTSVYKPEVLKERLMTDMIWKRETKQATYLIAGRNDANLSNNVLRELQKIYIIENFIDNLEADIGTENKEVTFWKIYQETADDHLKDGRPIVIAASFHEEMVEETTTVAQERREQTLYATPVSVSESKDMENQRYSTTPSFIVSASSTYVRPSNDLVKNNNQDFLPDVSFSSTFSSESMSAGSFSSQSAREETENDLIIPIDRGKSEEDMIHSSNEQSNMNVDYGHQNSVYYDEDTYMYAGHGSIF